MSDTQRESATSTKTSRKTWRRVFRWIGIGLLSIVLGLLGWDVVTFDRGAWQRDFDALEVAMAKEYANLDWMVEHRGVDLVKLDRDTRASLGGAFTRVQAFLALRRFVRTFQDPHFKLTRGAGHASPSPSENTSPSEAPPAPVASCAAAGYEARPVDFRFPFKKMPGFAPTHEAPFPAGVAGELGVIRIAHFGEDRYLATCEAVFKAGMDEDALRLAVRARLQEALQTAIGALRDRGARRLLVDLTGNGGGTEWVSEALALFTSGTLRRSEARIVKPSCDRTPIWKGEKVCSIFGDGPGTATLEGKGVWKGPLFVLADRGTGSASEDFVAWLKDNHAATILGARTAGAGCGYVNGGGRTALREIGFEVRMPNCARFLADGTNEVEGIAPDIALPPGRSDEEKIAALTGALAPLRD
ncbi:S41 family peptidase [Polyangium sp. 6x1]|uniref:S41 family peptidase n=1 Tax=Polyangium sp. 6x1 TaxID=3042689 RepID=UPI002482F53C|nr:S41 family peptidase [Polyangium sp. 6x1]MDI1442857.1 S41 family peptidase [Polyangium sp. 6x1]